MKKQERRRESELMQSSYLFRLDFFLFVCFYFGSAHLVSLHWSYVGHNIKRQAGFPLQQAHVPKTGDERGSERQAEGEGYRGMGKEGDIKK